MKPEWYRPEWEDRQEDCAYKDIPEHPVKLDFTGCRYIMQFHEILKDQLGLPNYYGKNWDALWDLVRDFRDYPTVIEIYGLNDLPKDLQPAVETMMEIFDDTHAESPHIEFVRKS